jgi:hypothetical protein
MNKTALRKHLTDIVYESKRMNHAAKFAGQMLGTSDEDLLKRLLESLIYIHIELEDSYRRFYKEIGGK